MKKVHSLLTVLFVGLFMMGCSSDPAKIEPLPVAIFAHLTDATNTFMVKFTNTSTNATTYAWDFGDGAKSTEQNPTHTYASRGSYTVVLKATGPGGEATKSVKVDISGYSASELAGSWVMANEAGALGVGPSANSKEWWSNSAADLATRACYFDDVFTFTADGKFTYTMGGSTWLEAWQGVAADACGAPISPFNGSGNYTFTVVGDKLTLKGTGAFIGLPKATNGAEIASNTAAPAQVIYTITALTGSRLSVYIQSGTAFWQFILVKK